MSQQDAPREIREVIAGRPGAVNRFIRRFSKPILDYATALLPDRSEPFDRLVEDIMVDAIAQARAAARHSEDEQVFEFVMECALRTVRARFRHVLEGEARPTKATTSYNFKEVLERTRMSEAELTAGISEGRIRAVRDNDQLKIKGDSIPGLGERKAYQAYHVSAAERELLCLHYRLHFSPETIANWAGTTPAQIEAMIGKAANHLTSAIAKKRGSSGPDAEDTEMRRYIDGRMEGDETAKFERRVLKDKIAQQRLDELRSQSDSIRELFDSSPYEMSSIAVNVRARNPHHALALPPVAALWLQVVGLAALMLMFHSVGSYIAPPEVQATAVIGPMTLSASGARSADDVAALAPGESRSLRIGDWLETPEGSQSMLLLDKSNRVLLAPGSKVHLLEPRSDARQVLLLENGEAWGRFASSSHAFAMQFGSADAPGGEIASDVGAEFDLVLSPGAALLPENLHRMQIRAIENAVETADRGGLVVRHGLTRFAGFRFGNGEEGLVAGDIIESVDGIAMLAPAELATVVRGMEVDQTLPMSVLRESGRLAFTLTRTSKQPWAVVRVFHGALVAGAPAGERALVNAGQWAAFYIDEPALVGLRGMEDFRVLRISASERFKDRVHWLNTQQYPLRAENSVLHVERELRALAESLEAMRAEKIQRNGEREIAEFENIMRAVIADARARIERDEAREKEPGSASLSDSALVAAEDEIMAIILNWKRRSTSGIYPTLGSAAKTLSAAILRDEAELEARGSELTQSLLRQDEIMELNSAIARQDTAITELKASEPFDGDGKIRADLDERIQQLDAQVREGASARSRRDLILVKLNDLDAKLDEQRRKLPDLEQSLADALAALAETNRLLDSNIYTPEKLKQAGEALSRAERTAALAGVRVSTAEEKAGLARSALTTAETSLKNAEGAEADALSSREAAADVLTDSVSARAAAQSELADAQSEVDRIRSELDSLPEGDPARESKQAELDAANAVLQEKQTALDDAVKAADDANAALKAAEAALEEARTATAAARTVRDNAATALKTADDELSAERKSESEAKSAVDRAKATLKAQEEAKSAREALEAMKEEQTTNREQSQAALDAVNGKIKELDAQAAPERDKLTRELELISAGEEAAKSIQSLRTERGRYQAVSDEIERRAKDRQVLVEQRDALASSDLVANFDRLQSEYQALSARIDAFKFVRARGLLEDSNFAYAQDAAQHAFREAAENAELQAVEVLQKYCPEYGHEKYFEWFGGSDGAELRVAVLSALWKLYYDAGIHASDEGDKVCYYVAVQSGADSRTLESLDNLWQAYLTSAFGNQGFEELMKLDASLLKPAG